MERNPLDIMVVFYGMSFLGILGSYRDIEILKKLFFLWAPPPLSSIPFLIPFLSFFSFVVVVVVIFDIFFVIFFVIFLSFFCHFFNIFVEHILQQ